MSESRQGLILVIDATNTLSTPTPSSIGIIHEGPVGHDRGRAPSCTPSVRSLSTRRKGNTTANLHRIEINNRPQPSRCSSTEAQSRTLNVVRKARYPYLSARTPMPGHTVFIDVPGSAIRRGVEKVGETRAALPRFRNKSLVQQRRRGAWWKVEE